MNKTVYLILILVVCHNAQATVLEYEGFDYAAGADLHNQVGWGHLITHTRSPLITDKEIRPGHGHALTSFVTDGGYAVRMKPLAQPIDVTTTPVYITALMTTVGATLSDTETSVNLGLANNTDPGQRIECLFAATSHTILFGGYGGYNTNSETSYSPGSLYRCVMKLTPIAGESNKVHLSAVWIDVTDGLTLGDESEYPYLVSNFVYDPGKHALARPFEHMEIGFRGAELMADDLMICDSWADIQNPVISPIMPSPQDGEKDVLSEATVLSWTGSPFASSYDVYMGTDKDAVANATKASNLFLGSQATTSISLTETLEHNQIYYWRVDELKDQHADSPRTNMWRFTVESFGAVLANITATASDMTEDPSLTIDGSGLDKNGLHSRNGDAMWKTAFGTSQPVWIQYAFDGIYQLYDMKIWNHNTGSEGLLGFGFKDVTVETSVDGTTWTALPDIQFAQAPGDDGYTSNTTVAFNGTAAQFVRLTAKSNWSLLGLQQYGLSEVQFSYIPLAARLPQPASGAVGILPHDLQLSWREGREALKHEVLLGTDMDNLALVGTVTQTSIDVSADVILDSPHYWQVNEVNEAGTVWEGPLWEFATGDRLLIDDMEYYKDWFEYRIWETWADGYEDPASNGAVVGHGDLPETDILRSYWQSLPIIYDNSGAPTSKAVRSFDQPGDITDWGAAGIQALVFYVHGDPNNTGGPLYVEINGVKVSLGNEALTKKEWTAFTIDLGSVNTNLAKVDTLAIGVDGANAGGVIYVDDIALYRNAPLPSLLGNDSFEDRGDHPGRVFANSADNAVAEIPGWTCTWSQGYVGWDTHRDHPAYTGTWHGFVNKASKATFTSDSVNIILTAGEVVDVSLMLASNKRDSSVKCTASLIFDAGRATQKTVDFGEVLVQGLTNLIYQPLAFSYAMESEASTVAVSVTMDNDFANEEDDQVRLDEVRVTVLPR